VSGGGQFGFNWQVQSWVIGLEADAQAAGATASSTANVNARDCDNEHMMIAATIGALINAAPVHKKTKRMRSVDRAED
jgi:hypothetical protein